MSDTDRVIFTCQDCNIDVVYFEGGQIPDPPRCLTCRMIALHADPEERTRMRDHFNRKTT